MQSGCIFSFELTEKIFSKLSLDSYHLVTWNKRGSREPPIFSFYKRENYEIKSLRNFPKLLTLLYAELEPYFQSNKLINNIFNTIIHYKDI